MPVEDYYSLIGVPADAEREEIKAAYRTRRAELDDSESSKARAAKLNKAWNVLGDDGQRDKYDEQLAQAKASDDVIVPEIMTDASRPKTRAEQRRARVRGDQPARPVRQPIPQRTEVNGLALASNRSRSFALVIDVLLTFLIVAIGSQFVMVQFAGSELVDSVTAKDKAVSAQKKVADRADSQFSKADKAAKEATKAGNANTIKATADVAAKAKADRTKQRETFDDLTKDLEEAQKKTLPHYRKALAVAGVVLMLLFAVPTALTGKSPGKALRKLRLVRDDGSPVGWPIALKRYGLVIGIVIVSGIALGGLQQFAWLIVLFGVSSFARHPDRQGWHDRFAKTFVVED